MTSCKLFTERGRSKVCHNADKGYTQQRKMPPILRLDSTGEISSATLARSGQSSKCYESNTKCSHSKDRNQHSLRGFLFDTVNSYIAPAASYIEGLCHNKTKSDLARSDSDTTALQYLQKLWKTQTRPTMGKDHSASLDSSLSAWNSPFNNINKSANKSIESSRNFDVSMNVGHDIFNVFQNRLVNNKMARTEKSKTGPYIPPPLKNKNNMLNNTCSERRVRFDPILTPYNARLLERSKSQRSDVDRENCKNCGKEHSRPSCHSKYVNGTIENKANTTALPYTNKYAVELNSASVETNCISHLSATKLDTDKRQEFGIDSQPANKVNDWFDYENETQNVIPIEIKPNLHTTPNSEKTELKGYKNHCGTTANSSIHSWLSLEFDVDVQKATENSLQSSKENKPQTASDRTEKVNIPYDSEVEQCLRKNVTCKSDTNSKNESMTKTEENLPGILYIRNCRNGRKGRPSSKKRRRQKVNPVVVKNENTDDTTAEKCAVSNSSTPYITRNNQTNSDDKNALHSFLIACDTDSSSDWSDSGDSDLEMDCGYENELCSFAAPLGLNFQFMCSIQPMMPSQSQNSLEAINLSWKVNISETPDKSKKDHSPSKKVSFVEDKNLATVHHMFAWSYAYAAARKGPWEEIARDRGRFLRRITDGEKLLRPILDETHRERIFLERFGEDLG